MDSESQTFFIKDKISDKVWFRMHENIFVRTLNINCMNYHHLKLSQEQDRFMKVNYIKN